jgi:hypothetical protein
MDRPDAGSPTPGPFPDDAAYRGQRLGLPESGPGSMAPFGRRVVALYDAWGKPEKATAWRVRLAPAPPPEAAPPPRVVD